MLEAGAEAGAGVLLGFLALYTLERFFEASVPLRLLIFCLALLACMVIPKTLYVWGWRRRRLEQLAEILQRERPALGDRIRGAIELAENPVEQARSPALVEAALRQVAESVQSRDLMHAIPNPGHRSRLAVALALGCLALLLAGISSAAAGNAWIRYLVPWGSTSRFTFTAMQSLPDRLVVPHGETFSLTAELADHSQWKPRQAICRIAGLPPITALRDEASYQFVLPALMGPIAVDLQAGDFRKDIMLEPVPRPELTSARAIITLPAYLKRSAPIIQDARGGRVSALRGSLMEVQASISRDLTRARLNEQDIHWNGSEMMSPPLVVEETLPILFDWQDLHGLSGRDAFRLEVSAIADAPPVLHCEGLPREQVLLDREVVNFRVHCHDDYGVKRVGYEWKSASSSAERPVHGERIIGIGSPETVQFELTATFSAVTEGIEPQPTELRVFVEDYLPERNRVYSSPTLFFVLNDTQHANWIAAELGRWQRQALDVHDRELQLHETNMNLRALDPAERSSPETQHLLALQVSAERMNSRELERLVGDGEKLLQQALRNPEIDVDLLEQWAGTNQSLKDIAARRMPEVADLLHQALRLSEASGNAETPHNNSQTENNRNQTIANSANAEAARQPSVPPGFADLEATRNETRDSPANTSSRDNSAAPGLTLPTTMLAGDAPKTATQPPVNQSLEQAVETQQELLHDFDAVVQQLQEVLSNLEGSTLVKRLKAASRQQEQLARKLGKQMESLFGVESDRKQASAESLREVARMAAQQSQEVSRIVDDLAAYYDRSRYQHLKFVLDEMQSQEVTRNLQKLGEDLHREQGLSMAQAEYWSETLDRWAENLVDVAQGDASSDGRTQGSLSPSIVLDVLLILEEEMNLRERTRMVEQIRADQNTSQYATQARQLADVQRLIKQRVQDVTNRILELPDAKVDLEIEVELLRAVDTVMHETVLLLDQPETGPPTIAAQTEVIELLLQSRRFTPGGGGGGGAVPGGGGGGETNVPALSLMGRGVNEQEVREDPGTPQTTGDAGLLLPEEFRSGLNEYFQKIERWRQD